MLQRVAQVLQVNPGLVQAHLPFAEQEIAGDAWHIVDIVMALEEMRDIEINDNELHSLARSGARPGAKADYQTTATSGSGFLPEKECGA